MTSVSSLTSDGSTTALAASGCSGGTTAEISFAREERVQLDVVVLPGVKEHADVELAGAQSLRLLGRSEVSHLSLEQQLETRAMP